MRKTLNLNINDNVDVITKDENLEYIGHKVANKNIAKDSPIIKYGNIIGISIKDINQSEHVHTQNIRVPSNEELINFSGLKKQENALLKSNFSETFMGYTRKFGKAGTRNYILVLSTVNCSATVSKEIAQRFRNTNLMDKGIDGVIPVAHSQGCAQAITGDGFKYLNKTLAGWLCNPNIVGALVVGLGCEGTTKQSILSYCSPERLSEIKIDDLNIQAQGGTLNAINEGIKRVQKIVDDLPIFKRTKTHVSNLTLALNCGGSDALSGLTANPTLGYVSDILAYLGGSSCLAEIPECHGLESSLKSRCINKEDHDKLDSIFNWWQDYSKKNSVTLNDNLSPGNINGGLSTIVEKSYGAVIKGGTSLINGVFDYAELIDQKGLSIMNTPGFDPVSVTGLVAGGCNLVAFTTGRGSVYGCSIAPTIKISTNTKLFKRMSGDIDFNAGELIEGELLTSELGIKLYEYIIDVASGKKTASELLNIGVEEFVPWHVGETL